MTRIQVFSILCMGTIYSIFCYLLFSTFHDKSPYLTHLTFLFTTLILYLLVLGLPPFLPEWYALRSFINLYVLHSPLILDYLQLLPNLGLQFLIASELPDIRPESIRNHHRAFINVRNNLQSYQSTSLNCKVVLYLLNNMVDLGYFGVYQFPIPCANMTCLYPISSIAGQHEALISFLANFDSFGTVRQFAQRVKQLPDVLDWMRESYFEEFHVAPKCVLEAVRNGLRVSIRRDVGAQRHPLVRRAERMCVSDRDEMYVRQIESIVNGPLIYSQRELLCKIESLIPDARSECGVSALLPNGTALYDLFLRMHTTTSSVSAGEIYQLGRTHVTELQIKIATLLQFPNQQWNPNALDEWSNHQSCDDFTEQEILNAYSKIADNCIPHLLSRYFYPRDVPTTTCQIQRMSPSQEETNPGAFYLPGQASKHIPGTFLANMKPGSRSRFCELKPLYFHEALPGHHLQLSISQLQRHLPIYRRQTPWFTAYCEGWALYAELLAYEGGMYDTEEERVGWMLMDLMRCARLVVDTGIHVLGWKRDEAVEFMVKEAGLQRGNACNEVDRYISMPGQACSYKIGQLFILKLREKCREAIENMGREMDLRDFHGLILRCGALPLEYLEGVVDEWIEEGCPSLA